MSTKNFFQQWVKPEFTKSIPGVPHLSFDMKAVLESSRKTFQAMTQAQQIAIESFQTIAQRQTEILSQMVQDQSQIAREIVNQGSPQDKVARGAEMARRAYEKTVSGFREVSDMAGKSGREASDIINKRVACALDEIVSSLEEQSQPSKKEARKEASSKQAA